MITRREFLKLIAANVLISGTDTSGNMAYSACIKEQGGRE
jgi:hypothetical protein